MSSSSSGRTSSLPTSKRVTFTPAALLGFETMLAEKAAPVVEDIRKKLASSDGAVHADETYWTTNGDQSYLWVHGDEKFIHFQYDTTRGGQVSRDILGNNFTGTLVTDCYSGHFASVAGAKQKCLSHVSRKVRDWRKLVEADSQDFAFFTEVIRFVNREGTTGTRAVSASCRQFDLTKSSKMQFVRVPRLHVPNTGHLWHQARRSRAEVVSTNSAATFPSTYSAIRGWHLF